MTELCIAPILRALDRWQAQLPTAPEPMLSGMLVRAVGMLLEAKGCQAPVGGLCKVTTAAGEHVLAEVIGFRDDHLLLTPLHSAEGFSVGGAVVPCGQGLQLPIGLGLIGRTISALGEPLDGLGPLQNVALQPVQFTKINPLSRPPIKAVLDVGIRAINGLLTVGRGQRIGLFAGSGVGKSVLLGMMARNTDADIIVVGLIGERGREVKEFIDEILGPEGLKKAVVVVAPADDPAMLRLYGARTATLIAELFRAQGKHVLLLMDSLTRYAQAQREISLAAGEPPATKGYTPSVFAKLPALVERAGTDGKSGGSITGFYTVLCEGDDQQGPIADAARAILDGHIVLDRRIAEQGIYPAINIETSISRVMSAVAAPEHLRSAQEFKRLLACYTRNGDLVRIGAYKPGSDPELDQALELYPAMRDFLSQGMTEACSLPSTLKALQQLSSPSPTTAKL